MVTCQSAVGRAATARWAVILVQVFTNGSLRDRAGLDVEVIRYMVDSQEEHFDRLGLAFNGLRGRRLQLIDCQNLFCEVDKYARVAHPDVRGISGRTRIKQKYVPDASPLTAWSPPKWNLNGAFRPTAL
jgi:5-hmdU DNA kinase, helical domain